MPFHKTTTFVVCVVLLVAVIILFVIIGPRAGPYAKLPKNENRPPVALAQDTDTQKPLLCALTWDFVFIPIYTAGLFLLCFIAGRFADDLNLVSLGVTKLIIAVVIAGVFIDVAENVALMAIICGSPESLWKTIAEWGTRLKYSSPILGTAYSLMLGVWCVVTAPRR